MDINAELDKISELSDGQSGLSLGTGGWPKNLAKHSLACHESSSGTYFYGCSLYDNQVNPIGLGIWGGSTYQVPDRGTGTGQAPPFLINSFGKVGIANVAPAEALDVVGNLTVSGTITAGTKCFDIVHPDPAKTNMRLRHWCVETADYPGGSVMYRRTVDMTSTTQSYDMPDWFQHLVKEPIVMVTPFKHFGSAWGEVEGNTVTIHVTTLGQWHVLLTGGRKDHCATMVCPQEVEYVPSPPTQVPQGFPST